MKESPPAAVFALEKMAVSTMPLADLHEDQQSRRQPNEKRGVITGPNRAIALQRS